MQILGIQWNILRVLEISQDRIENSNYSFIDIEHCEKYLLSNKYFVINF